MLKLNAPYCVRKQSPDSYLEMLKYLECKDGDETNVHLKETDAYHYQQLNICDVPYGDFVVWTEAGIFVERILPQPNFFIKQWQMKKDFRSMLCYLSC